jgi:decaprenyl-phosphate phosphoribosyltransferase
LRVTTTPDQKAGTEGTAQPDQPVQGGLLPGLVRLARPKQWAKNLLVFAAPGADGALTDRVHLTEAAVAFVCFCLAAAGTYYINDARDAEADRLHPRKSRRPVAAGTVPRGLAYAGGIALLAMAIGLALTVNWRLTGVVAGYVVLTTLY